MIAWALSLIGGLTLRVKLIALGVITLSAAIGYLYLRFKIASTRARTAQEKAEKLEQARALEKRIAAARAKTREKQDKLREQIRARKKNDYFER